MERDGLKTDQRLKWIKVKILYILYFHYEYNQSINQSINRNLKTEKERIRTIVTLIHLL